MTDKIPLGRGRGSLLDIMRQREQERRRREYSVETPSQSSSDPTKSFEGHSFQSSMDQTRLFEEHLQSSFETQISATVKGRGRANLASLMKLRNSDNVLESQQIKTVGQSRSTGRGTLLDLLPKQIETSTSTSSSAHTSAFVEKDFDGVLGALDDLTVYDNPPSPVQDVEESATPICRQGISGKTIKLSANYIDVELEPGRGLFQYEVKYSPDIDARGLRRSLLNQHASQLGREKTFDGAILFLPMQLPEKITKLCSVHPVDGSNVTLTVIYKKKQSMSENVQFFNILFGRIMRALSLVRIGRQNFNPKTPHFIDEHQLEVWPGYVTAINEYEGGLKLCLDIKHRVLRTQTVRDIMTDMYHRQRNNYRDYVMKEIVGMSVLTRYNNRTYRIDDIAWDKTPEFKFSKNGEEISLINYYKTYCGIEIRDMTQPLLVNRATERTPTGEKQEKILLLIPELSYISGLTDSIRSNYKIMKDLDMLTKVSPSRRCDEIKLFVETIQQNEVTRQMLAGWGLRLNKDVVQFSARSVEPEKIYFGNNKYYEYTDKPEWMGAAARNPVLRTPHLNRWYILYINKDENIVRDFLSMLQNITKAIGMRINNPQKIILRDEKNESYLREIRGNFNKDYELVVAVFPTNRTDRYNSLKRLCCVEKPIASQVILTRTLVNPSKLKNVTEKIALQINCKLGGALWTVTMPLMCITLV
ncbi:piwi-like protein Ago3 isoform X2 [Odontomachus brunneus]|uniref:piwi-like protein Ago3 isoform X2 n=1 Tax=Odontomachus brunneus TaxID=486640 RepID=UPI0013F29430|nr:piwi-like protein Ago3 isoform X2 [Odontomachus brunneus]